MKNEHADALTLGLFLFSALCLMAGILKMTYPPQTKEITMEAYQQRVVTEHAELSERLTKLESFLLSPDSRKLPDEDLNLLSEQRSVMVSYKEILQKRINRFQ